MTPTSPRTPWPFWVRVVLWKTNRRSARTCMWLSLLGAVLCATVAIGCVVTVWWWKAGVAAAIFAVLFFLVTVFYDRAIVWVDGHGKWE
jgi:hypothetical protein